jgi:hypothetical protein
LASLTAVAVTGAYAYPLSLVWGRWLARFDRLPPDDPFAGLAVETVWGIGIGILAVSWVASVYVLSRGVVPTDAAGGATIPRSRRA